MFGSEPGEHRRIANHLCAEAWDPAKGKFEQRSQWNHFLDCVALAHAAANMVGVRILADMTRRSGQKAMAPRVQPAARGGFVHRDRGGGFTRPKGEWSR